MMFGHFNRVVSWRWLLVAAMLLAGRDAWAQTSSVPVTVVSAASSSGNAIAPECAATAYGLNLATAVVIADKLPLPTVLGGTVVKVNDKPAPLFFVSPGQINFVVPKEAGTGDAMIEVTAGNGAVSRGTFRINRVGPAVFSANGNGQGPPVAYLLRFRDGAVVPNQPPVADYDAGLGRFISRPIDLGGPNDLVFLIFYMSGIRNALDPNGDGNVNESVHIVLGGVEIQPAYAGASPDLAGADQVNLQLPRSLLGRGRVALSVTSEGTVSNQVELIIATPPGAAPPSISGFGLPQVLAGQRLVINGRGFSTNAAENVVRIGEVEARVVPDVSNQTQLTVEVPFGVKTGRVSVSTPQGEGVSEGVLAVKTSISGYVVDTSPQPQPLRGALVRAKVGDRPEVTMRTADNGSFVLPDMDPGTAFIRVDGSTVTSGLPYTTIDTKIRVEPSQDNRFGTPVALQQIVGATARLSPDSPSSQGKQGEQVLGRETSFKAQQPIRLAAGDVVFEIPAGAEINPPASALTLTIVEQSRVPARLPEAVFSQRIVQVTPFGVTIKPGAKLTFPNTDKLAAGAKLDLYSFDKNAVINLQDAFVKIGTATVSADGQRVETEADAVKETSYFFVAVRQQRTTAIGQVVDNDKPVRQVIVQVRGQSDFTDGNGGFVPRDVALQQTGQPGQNDPLQAEASFQRPTGGVIYTTKSKPPAPGGTTDFGKIPINLLTTNVPPVLLVPAQIVLNVGQTTPVKFSAYDPDADTITIQRVLMVQGSSGNPNADFVQLILNTDGNGNHTLRFTPQAADVGEYTLTITVADEGAQKLTVQKAIAISVIGTPGTVTLNPANVVCDGAVPSGPAVQLNWAPAPRAVTYDVIRGTNEVVGKDVAGTAFLDKPGLTAGGGYTYRVVAKNPAGSGPPSNPIQVSIPPNVCASAPVTISLGPPSGTLTQGSTTVIPIVAGDLSGRNVIAYEFELAFNAGVLQFEDYEAAGTLSGTMNVVTNATGGVVKVAAFVAAPIGSAERSLLKLRFRVVGAKGATTSLIWQRFLLNEGDLLQTMINGGFTVN